MSGTPETASPERAVLEAAIRSAAAGFRSCRSPKKPCEFCEAEIAGVMKAADAHAGATAAAVLVAAEGKIEAARAAERKRIRDLADRTGAACTGDEGTSFYFSALLADPGPEGEPG